MKISSWLRMLISTAVVGVLASVIFGTILQATDPELSIFDPALLAVHILAGLLYCVLCQLGFIAYLTVNYFAAHMFRKKIVWIYVQWFFILMAFVYLVFLRSLFFEENNQGVLVYTVLPVLLFAVSIPVVLYKVKLTNRTAFTPTLFFMFAITAVELIPALRENDPLTTAAMAIPVFACNAWLILNLHKYTGRKDANA